MPHEQEYYEGEISGEENEYSADERMSDNEQEFDESAGQQELTEQELKDASEQLKRRTEKQLKSVAPPAPEVQLKTKDISVSFEGNLKTLTGDGLEPPSVSLADNFGDHIGQLVKVEVSDISSTFPCTLACTIKGAKAPEPKVEVANSPVKGHLIITPKQVKSAPVTLFEADTKNTKKSVEAFEKKYAGVNASNVMTKGVGRSISNDKQEVFEDNAALKYYLEHSHKMTVAEAKKNELSHALCTYIPQTNSFVLNKAILNDAAKYLSDRLTVAKSGSLNELKVSFDRARVSENCKEDRWVDQRELSHYAPNQDAMDKLYKQPQKCEMMLRVHYF